jgi:hypothetical protein
MFNINDTHEFYNAAITLVACGAFVSGMVAFYYALTYDRTVVLARLRRKR